MRSLLIVCEFASLNGGERSMLSTLAGIAHDGFQIRIAAPPAGQLAEILRATGIEVVPFSMHNATEIRRSSTELRADLDQIIARTSPDLLHANSLAMGRLCGPVAQARNLPSLAHLRDIIRLSAQAVADLNCHRRILAVSEATRAYHVAGGLTAAKTFVLHNGVDLDRFRPRSSTGWLHRELGIPSTAPLIGTIGQISARKGQDVLLQAALDLAATHPDVHYLIIGQRFSAKEESCQFEADLRRRAEEGLPGRFHFLGVRSDVAEILNEMTLLVHAARQEPLGRVLLEAAASGVAIVATRVGGTEEIFPATSDAARLVAAGDADALATAIHEILADPIRRHSLATASRQRALEAFDVGRATEGLIAHYHAVL